MRTTTSVVVQLTLTSIAMLAALLPSAARAQLTNCASLAANPGDYKVVVDDFSFASVTAENNRDLVALNDRLQFNLNGQLELLTAAAHTLNPTLRVPLRVVACSGRKPSINGNEFTAALAERLSDQRVVVEVWGTLNVSDGTDSATPTALVGYVIPPVQYYAHDDQVPPIHVLAYPKTGSAQVLDELENLPELSAFALIGLATKAARAGRYDLAVWAFTRAESGIRDAKLAGNNPNLDSLLAYAQRSACTTRNAARNNAGYSGPLKLMPIENCGGVQ